jgi:DhnA family fructose-bisphosphate aldolase class Ia
MKDPRPFLFIRPWRKSLTRPFLFSNKGGKKIMMGKRIRMERIMDRSSGRTVIIPMDHGVTLGPMEGLVRIQETIQAVARGGANAIVIHKGLVEMDRPRSEKDLGLIVHLSASTRMAPDSNCKIMVCTVEEAIKLGADAVSVHVNLGAEDEKSMLRDLGAIAREAMEWGMPLLAMMYTRGPKVEKEYDVRWVKHAARVGATSRSEARSSSTGKGRRDTLGSRWMKRSPSGRCPVFFTHRSGGLEMKKNNGRER